MELWDAYKIDGTPAGCLLVRGEPIPDGLYHLVSEVLVRHVDGSFLLTQRDYSKPSYPGFYEASAGGSVLAGESPYNAAIRELKEETGIKVSKLKHIYRFVGKHTIYFGYLCITDCAKDSVKLQEKETISYMWLPKDEFLKFIETDKYVQSHKERIYKYLAKIM